MTATLRHIALYVPDLRSAEGYYQSLFDMDLIGREAEIDGAGYTLPFDKGWDQAEAAGIELHMLALRRGEFVLALFQGDAAPGQVFAIGVAMAESDIAGLRARLPQDAVLTADQAGYLEFLDRYRITWQISTGGDFRTAGDFAGRWLNL